MGDFISSSITEALSTCQDVRDENDGYGVFLDEMHKLADIEDKFDTAENNGPDPAIEEELDKYQPYTLIETPYLSININKMAYNMFLVGYTIIVYGPRRSGKSKFIKNLCQRLRPYYPNAVCFTKTKSSCEYHSFLPDTCIIEGLDEPLLLKLLLDQAKKKRAESRGIHQGNYNLLLIIDDCMAEKLRYRDIFNMVFFNGRHYNVTLIVTVQDVKGIAPAATLNADMAVTFCLPDRRGRDTIREKFVDYLDRRQFDTIMDDQRINKKYHLLCFDIAHRYNNIDTRISFGSVDEKKEEKFVLGNKELWKNDKQQLKDLGFEKLLNTDDWGIIE